MNNNIIQFQSASNPPPEVDWTQCALDLPDSCERWQTGLNAHSIRFAVSMWTRLQYVAIKVKQFSYFGVTGPVYTELQYMSLKFYKPIATNKVDYVFAVVQDNELYVQVNVATILIFTVSYPAHLLR